MKESLGKKKKQKLRNNEYYDMQEIYDDLYEKAKKNYQFKDLMKYITNEKNILLAYRNIKNNGGSRTKGTDGKTISYYDKMNKDDFVRLVQKKFMDYKPKSVRRVEIPKNNGKKRPLGIPCMIDRIMQQCIKQVMEPICEAKFHKYSFGFRPNRSTNHAIARCMHLINRSGLHYVVDIDIKGFFDNVNHAKLKKQIWYMGIHDKNLIKILGKILLSEIEGIGIPNKGIPQGGIISPLLSNIVLNELDWWLSSQYDTLKTKYALSGSHHKRLTLSKTGIKEIKFVRYADDFKIFCRDYKTAQRIFLATRMWLKERLGLDISPDKSKITNLRRNYAEFLGFKFKAVPKRKTYVCKSHIRDEALKRIILNLKNKVKDIQKNQNKQEVSVLNGIIIGCHNYYKYASHVSQDFQKISFLVNKSLDIRLKDYMTNKHIMTRTYHGLYGNYKGKLRTIYGITIFPIYGCKNVPPMQFNQKISDYTEAGRKLIHDKIGGYDDVLGYLLSTQNRFSTEYNDNRISLFIGQGGRCYVTGDKLNKHNMECHHKIPKSDGGSDDYSNLVWINGYVHKLIHSTKTETIETYKKLININTKTLKKLNSLRKLVGNLAI